MTPVYVKCPKLSCEGFKNVEVCLRNCDKYNTSCKTVKEIYNNHGYIKPKRRRR